MTNIQIELEDRKIRQALNALLNTGSDMGPVMRTIAGHMAASTDDAFENQATPDGTPWVPLSERRTGQREKRGQVPVRTLVATGDLMRSIFKNWDDSSAVAGTSIDHASTHQFGGTPDMAPGPAAIPARPFLGLADQQRHLTKDDIAAFITRPWT